MPSAIFCFVLFHFLKTGCSLLLHDIYDGDRWLWVEGPCSPGAGAATTLPVEAVGAQGPAPQKVLLSEWIMRSVCQLPIAQGWHPWKS